MLGARYGRSPSRPRQFSLKDLAAYSAKMNAKDTAQKGGASKFKGRYADIVPKRSQNSLPPDRADPKPGAVRAPANHDWQGTPIYRRFVLNQSEEEALRDTELVQGLLETIKEEREQRRKKKSPALKLVVNRMMSKKQEAAPPVDDSKDPLREALDRVD